MPNAFDEFDPPIKERANAFDEFDPTELPRSTPSLQPVGMEFAAQNPAQRVIDGAAVNRTRELYEGAINQARESGRFESVPQLRAHLKRAIEAHGVAQLDTPEASLADPLVTLRDKVPSAQTVQDALDVIAAAGTATGGGFTTPRADQAERAQEIMQAPSRKPGAAAQATTGALKATAGAGEFLTSPLGVATLGSASAQPWLQQLMTLGFSADMLAHTPELSRKFGEASVSGDTEEKVEALGDLLLNSAMVFSAGKHSLTPEKVTLSRRLAKELLDAQVEAPTKMEQAAPVEARAMAGANGPAPTLPDAAGVVGGWSDPVAGNPSVEGAPPTATNPVEISSKLVVESGGLDTTQQTVPAKAAGTTSPVPTIPRADSPEFDALPLAAKGAAGEYHINQRTLDTGLLADGKTKAAQKYLEHLRERQPQVEENFRLAVESPSRVPLGIDVPPEQWAEMATLTEEEQLAKYGTSRARLMESAAVAKYGGEPEKESKRTRSPVTEFKKDFSKSDLAWLQQDPEFATQLEARRFGAARERADVLLRQRAIDAPAPEFQPEQFPLIDQPAAPKPVEAERQQIERILTEIDRREPEMSGDYREKIKPLLETRLAQIEEQLASERFGQMDDLSALSGAMNQVRAQTFQREVRAQVAPEKPVTSVTTEEPRAADHVLPLLKTLSVSNVETKADVEAAQSRNLSPVKRLKAQKQFLLDALDQELKTAPPEKAYSEVQQMVMRSAKLAVEATQHYLKSKYIQTDNGFAKFAEREHAASVEMRAKIPHIEIEVPGDGTFTIAHTSQALHAFRDKVAKEFPSGASGAKAPAKARTSASEPAKLNEKPTPEDVRKAILSHVSLDESRVAVNTGYANGKEMVGTDGRRLIRVVGKTEGTNAKPLRFGEKWMRAETKDHGNFPDFTQVIPRDSERVFIGSTDAAQLWKWLKQADLMTSEKGNSVKLWRNKDGSFGVTSNAPDVGESAHNHSADAQFVGAFQPQYLMEALESARMLGNERVDIYTQKDGPLAPLVIRGRNHEDIIMPMRDGGEGALEVTPLDRAQALYKPLPEPVTPVHVMESAKQALKDLPGEIKKLQKQIQGTINTRERVRLEVQLEELRQKLKLAKAKVGGTSGMGDPMGAPAAPPIHPPSAAPGTTMVMDARVPVTMNRTKPGSVSIPEIMSALETVQRVAGSAAGNIRVKRFLQKARGIFKPHEEIIRLNSADNIPTAVHEVGHALQQQMYGTAKASGLKSLPANVGRELVGMGKALYGSRKPVAGYSGEGFAEFMRYYLTTEDAGKVAPHTLKYFESVVLPAHPEVAKSLQSARAKIDVWRHMGAEERARRQLVREPGAFARVAKALWKFAGYQSQFESFAALEAVSKAARAQLGHLPADRDPFQLASWKRGSAGATIETMVTRHMIDVWGNPVGRSLAEALAPVKGQRQEFMLYLLARRAIERWGKGQNPGITLEDAQHIRALYGHVNFSIAAQNYYDWWDGVLRYVVQADPTTAPLVAKIKRGSTDYAPLARMIDPVKAKALAAKAQSNPLLRMHGSGLPVKDIFDQTFINAARLINRANRGLVTNAIVKLARVQGLGHIIEEVPRDRVHNQVNVEMIRAQLEDMGVDTSGVPENELLEYYTWARDPKGSDPIVRYTDAAGKVKWYQVDPRLYETLDGLHTYSLKESFPGIPGLGVALDFMLGAPARTFRLGTTGLRPAFSLVTNPLRDLQTLLAQTHTTNPAKVAAAYPSALAGVLREGLTGKAGPYVQAFYDLGAHMGQPLGLDLSHTRRVSNELFHGRFLRVALNPIDHLRQLFSLPEAAPRVAELKAMADEVGWKPGTPMMPDQAVQMALAAKRVTVDFSAAGDASRVLNAAIPFYNPALQGLRGFARAFREHPLRTPLLAMSLFTVPALLNWWKNKDEEWYRALPFRERYIYNNVDDGQNVWRIPRAFEWGMAFQAIPEAVLDSWYQHDPEAVKEALSVTFDNLNPADYPVLLRAAKEQWQNRIDYFARPIVPRGEEDLPPSDQIGPYTTKFARELAQLNPKLSPRRIDAFIHAYFGGGGPDALSLIGLGAPKSEREAEPSDAPVLGGLFRRGGEFNAQNQHITDFYESYLPMRAQVESWNMKKGRGKFGADMPEPPAAEIFARAKLGEKFVKVIRLYTQLANAESNREQRAQYYRLAGQWAEDGFKAMKAASPAAQ